MDYYEVKEKQSWLLYHDNLVLGFLKEGE